MDYTWFLMVSGVLSLGTLGYYARLWRRLDGGSANAPYRLGDILAALGLCGFFLTMLAGWIYLRIILNQNVVVSVNFNAILSNVITLLGLVAFVVCFLVFRGINPVSAFGLRWKGWPRGMVQTLAALAAVLPLICFFQVLAHQFMAPGQGSQAAIQYFLDNPGSKDRLAFVALALVAAPLTEELIFRGYLYGVARKYAGRTLAIIATSAFFALIHMHLASMPGLFALAVALAIVYESTKTLWAPIFMHAAFNSISVVVLLNWPQLAL